MIIRRRYTSKVDIYITDSISDFEDYEELFKELPKLSRKDSVNLHLNTPGGRCDVGFEVVNAVQKCAAKVHMVVNYPTSSMGAILALAGDSIEFMPHTYLMFHDYSGGTYGKGEDTLMYTENFRRVFKTKFKSICKPFLTEKESNAMFKGEDIYIHHDDPSLKKRIERHFK